MSSWYPVPHNPTHGIFVQRHAKAVSILHDVCVLYCAGTENELQQDIHRTKKEFSEHIRFYNKQNKRMPGKLRALRKLYTQAFDSILSDWGRPDLIHLNVVLPGGIFAFALAKRHNIPMVVTEHWTGYLPEDGSYCGVLKKHLTKKVIKYASAVCPVTTHLANAMRSHGLNGNYFPVPNVVDTETFIPSAKRETAEIAFLHVSSFDERQKNPKSIIDAFIKVHETNSSAKLTIAGDGDNIGELKEYAKDHPAITFRYRPAGDELIKLYQESDALVMNSNYENLPVVILEAMSCGLPVISSSVGGIAEYVNERSGILFSPPSVSKLTEAMGEFIRNKNKFDPKYIREFAVQQFSREKIAGAYSDIYNKVLC